MRSRTSLEAALTENQEMPEPQDRIIAESCEFQYEARHHYQDARVSERGL